MYNLFQSENQKTWIYQYFSLILVCETLKNRRHSVKVLVAHYLGLRGGSTLAPESKKPLPEL